MLARSNAVAASPRRFTETYARPSVSQYWGRNESERVERRPRSTASWLWPCSRANCDALAERDAPTALTVVRVIARPIQAHAYAMTDSWVVRCPRGPAFAGRGVAGDASATTVSGATGCRAVVEAMAPAAAQNSQSVAIAFTVVRPVPRKAPSIARTAHASGRKPRLNV